MKVVLIDMDIEKGKTRKRRPFPNLALMKISTFHKQQGDEVYLNFPLQEAGMIYGSCVFTWHSHRLADIPPGSPIGGPGVNLTALPPEVEHLMPDYSLYDNTDFSMGFTTRGCIRKCPWCKVPALEGNIVDWASFHEFWNPKHSKIILLDNNLLAAPSAKETLSELVSTYVEVDFNQGLDIRLMNDEFAWYLKRVRTRKLRFAFDDISYENSVREGIRLLLQSGISPRHLSFYVLCGFKKNDYALERMRILGSLKVDVYPMLYKGDDGKEPGGLKWVGKDMLWHGPRGNLKKFLRVAGRLP